MIKNDLFADEPQFLCDVCSEAVTNPLCPSCLTQEVQAWLTLYPDLDEELMPRIDGYIKRMEPVFDSTLCIRCGEKVASICPCCFTNFVFSELLKIQAGRLILREFIEFFDFDFQKNVYKDLAEDLKIT